MICDVDVGQDQDDRDVPGMTGLELLPKAKALRASVTRKAVPTFQLS
jgi:hypothetical protein